MRNIAIHAHFYQPPRENPWSGEVELQPDAHPFHDWNERITDECYRPNSAAHLLDEREEVRGARNNYASLSFDVGPTLTSWLARHAPDVLEAVKEGDRSGRGALAQPYAHPILPLCTRREKRLQLLWGLHDFEHRFGRKAEGVWLPETAVDHETLEVVADLGLRFTILAPHQARRVGPACEGETWTPVDPESFRPREGFRCALAGGGSVDIVFYDRTISHGVAFEGLLRSGEELAERLVASLGEVRDDARLVMVATDGESYGHHHRFGEMALATALETLESVPDVTLGTPGAFLAANPPRREVEIESNTSWSCPHGVERWRSDCGCRTQRPGEGETGQSWRGPLRRALEALRDRLEDLLTRRGGPILRDVDSAAEEYGRLVARETPDTATFLRRHLLRPDDETARRRALDLMEMQRHALLMFASCGWFFGRLDGLEPVQCLRHAGRAIDHAVGLGAEGLEEAILSDLAAAPGPSAACPDGAAVWRTMVRSASQGED